MSGFSGASDLNVDHWVSFNSVGVIDGYVQVSFSVVNINGVDTDPWEVPSLDKGVKVGGHVDQLLGNVLPVNINVNVVEVGVLVGGQLTWVAKGFALGLVVFALLDEPWLTGLEGEFLGGENFVGSSFQRSFDFQLLFSNLVTVSHDDGEFGFVVLTFNWVPVKFVGEMLVGEDSLGRPNVGDSGPESLSSVDESFSLDPVSLVVDGSGVVKVTSGEGWLRRDGPKSPNKVSGEDDIVNLSGGVRPSPELSGLLDHFGNFGFQWDILSGLSGYFFEDLVVFEDVGVIVVLALV